MQKHLSVPLAGVYTILLLLAIPLHAGNTDERGRNGKISPIYPGDSPMRLYVGPVGGFNQNFHSSGFESFANDAHCPDFSDGVATGLFFGASAELFLENPKDAASSLVFRLLIDDRPASFSVNDVEYPQRIIFEDGSDNVLNPRIRHEAEIDYTLLSFDVLYKLRLGKTPFGISVGPSFGLAFDVNIEQTLNVVSPVNAYFEDAKGRTLRNSGRTMVLHDGEVPDRTQFRLGIKTGILYEMNYRQFIVVPHVSYDYGLTKLTSRDNLRVNAFQAGVDIRYAL